MGIAEGAITPGFMLLTSMFYTRAEQTRRVGYWCEVFLWLSPPLRFNTLSNSLDEWCRHHNSWLRCIWRDPHH